MCLDAVRVVHVNVIFDVNTHINIEERIKILTKSKKAHCFYCTITMRIVWWYASNSHLQTLRMTPAVCLCNNYVELSSGDLQIN